MARRHVCASEQSLGQLRSTVAAKANQLARTMNASDRHSRYKGLNVTVRWQMVYGKTSLAPLFNTSYSIAEMDDEPPHWHYFPDRLFHSKEYAAAFALREARWLIDRRA